MEIKLIAHTNQKPLDLASHAAKTCYTSQTPEMGKQIDVQNRLFAAGHHTTLQHSYFTFSLEGVDIGSITFGLHLVSPFYNSDQRSGRFAAKMFSEPDLPALEQYISEFYPEAKEHLPAIRTYLEFGIKTYQDNLSAATDLAVQFIKTERPFAGADYIEQNAKKFAQEQLRNFIPLLFPTGLDITLNLTALVALYETAYTPILRHITQEMAHQIVATFPEVAFMFEPKKQSQEDWTPAFPSKTEVKLSPACNLLSTINLDKLQTPAGHDQHPVDHLQFDPRFLENHTSIIHTQVEVSCATFGQDQRHRTLQRSTPRFTGGFYLPPLCAELNLQTQANELMQLWLNLQNKLPKTLLTSLVPYGAMVAYEKMGNLNAVLHEQNKRLCWCAQEEIYEISRQLREQISEPKLKELLAPTCFTGACGEGVRYCGRDVRNKENYFPKREI
jgi:thymidylate synthase ThyX